MARISRIVCLAVAVVALAWPITGEAGNTISKNNPYRSFNISGINYGSMQWEREHGNQSHTPRRSYRGRR